MSRNEPSRRRLLTGLGAGLAAATAGCLGSGGTGGDGTETASPTRTASPTSTSNTATPPGVETPAPGECDPTRPEPSAPEEDGLEPAPYPELPDDPNAKAAASFARSFERAFTRNAVVAGTSALNAPGGVDRLEFYDGSAEPSAAGSGFIVAVSFSITYADDASDETPDATGETPSPAPTGHTGVSARYYVTDRFALRRSEGGRWSVVACA